MFSKKESDYNLRKNAIQTLMIMAKYRQVAREAKDLIFKINTEEAQKEKTRNSRFYDLRNLGY